MAVVIKSGASAPASKYAQHLQTMNVQKPVGTTTVELTGPSAQEMHPSSVVSKTTHDVAGWMATEGPVAVVKVGGGHTLNMGDYNSVKLYVEVALPVAPASLMEGYEFATDWVSSRLQEAIQQVKG